MVELIHDTPPRLLENRRENYTPSVVNPPKVVWKNFRGRNGKNILRDKLKILQNGLCVYCEERLDKYGFHIEHILSKSLNPLLTFEYINLSLSCIETGTISSETTTNPISCGHAPLKRDNLYNENLFIKPTEAGSSSLFQYKRNGEIAPTNGISTYDILRVEHTIDVLNLNCLRLKRDRREIIDAGLNIILDLIDDNEALQNFLNLEFEVVNNKYLFPFISAREEHYNLFRV
jgi:uncharacterized protein (TIGR02646 family)